MKLQNVIPAILIAAALAALTVACRNPASVTPVDATPTTAATARPTTPPATPTATPVLPEKGSLQVEEIISPALTGNLIDDPDTRQVVVYLPPSYEFSDKHYPVVYVLHYYTGDEWSEVGAMQSAIDGLIASGDGEEIILVFPDANNKFGGSWYLSSPTIGDYESYITRDLVGFIDTNFRTIPDRESRGVTGCSMGGDGAIHLGLTFPDVFSLVAPVSGAYDYENDPLWAQAADHFREAPNDFTEFNRLLWMIQSYMAGAAGAAPNPDNPPFYLDMPFKVVDGEGQIVTDVFETVQSVDATHEIHDYLAQPARLRGLMIYHGADDRFTPVEPVHTFIDLLTELGVEHEYLEVEGGHCDLDYKPVVQFMSDHLIFEESQ